MDSSITVTASSPVVTHHTPSSSCSSWRRDATIMTDDSINFLPDFTEHPKPPKRRKSLVVGKEKPDAQVPLTDDSEEPGLEEVTFMQDFIAGGMAGTASVFVGHPLDTLKVRVQTTNPGMNAASSSSSSLLASIAEFGGVSSLFRGMAAPLCSAAIINAIVFASYGLGSRLYDSYLVNPPSLSANTVTSNDSEQQEQTHDPWQKAMTCGAFAGLGQCTIICPMEHVKCRLQVQHGRGSADNVYRGPMQATKSILRNHGFRRLYQGWWSTVTREVPAFGVYFAVYDYMKDKVNTELAVRQQQAAAVAAGITSSIDDYSLKHNQPSSSPSLLLQQQHHTHTWIASALAGGLAGIATWAVVYPIDVIKTKIQTSPLDTPLSQLTMFNVGRSIVAKHGWRRLFRGLSITLIRAVPVNATIFPVYEFTLIQLNKVMGSGSSWS